MLGEAGERLVDVQRSRARIDLETEVDPRVERRGIDAQPDRGEVRIRFRVQDLDGLTGTDGALDVERCRVAELDVDAEVVGERGLDDLLLDLAVEGDGDLVARRRPAGR